MADLSIERSLRDGQAAQRIAGVDEAGRGPVAGPVVAAAVVLDPDRVPDGLADSKTLPAKRREQLFEMISADAETAVAFVGVDVIDRINILRAAMLAMHTAVARLGMRPDHVLVDGPFLPEGLPCPGRAVVRGDSISASIAAASIVAKVSRDRHMSELALQFPRYGWERNAGYLTREHREALLQHGVTQHHRRSFRPIHKML